MNVQNVMTQTIYLIGSLRNPNIPHLANEIRQLGFNVFDDWFAPGPEADDWWQQYEMARGHTYEEALQGCAARHIFEFDFYHLSRADLGLLVLPTGRSGHLEFGWLRGRGRPGYILLDNPERWDVMYQFASGVFSDKEKLFGTLTTNHGREA